MNERRDYWERLAACRDSDLDFFDDEPDAVAAAKKVCSSCPVRLQCLHKGREEDFGIWGGLTPSERRKAAKKRAAAAGE